MSIGAERTAVQNPFIRCAEEAGWTYLTPEEALNLRRGMTSPVLDSVLIDQLQKLNPGIVDHQRAEQIRDRLVRVRPNIEGNLDAWEYMKGLKTVFVETEKRERNVDLFDFENVEPDKPNKYHVTDELVFSNGTPPDIRTDINFFINGVPVIVSETKSARRREGIAEALDDLRHYHREGPELLAVMQLHALAHLVQFYYGATWNLSRKGLFNWRDEQAGDFETLVKTFIAPRRVLRVVQEFILFTRKDEELAKVVLRPHQMRATERCVARAKDTKKRRGLIWHTQGSGKTYTMLTVAKRLIEEDLIFENPTVLMLVDRNELEAQLFRNLDEAGIKYVEVNSKRQLAKLLKADRRGLIVSMLHKFDKIEPDLIQRDNVFVLVDEAHRTTGGDLGNYLMAAVPNATYLGFTGTPIDKTAYGKGTFKVFGTDDPKGYLDKYSIRESVADGTTVPLHYQLAPNDLLVDRETLEREFLDLAEAYRLTRDQEKTIRKKFRKPDEQPKILIVTEKLLTGFDAPILYCLYLDKPMRDHVLLQAIARVNRPYEDDEGRRKTCGFVLDFVGIFDKLEKALAFDSKDVEGVVEGLHVLKERFAQLMEHGRQKYLPIAAAKSGDKAVEAILDHFRDTERREEFYAYFREIEELHEIISPDVFMRPFLPDYGRLAEMYEVLRSNYDRGVIVDKEFLRKTAQLVREHTETTAIQQPTKLQRLDSDTLQALADDDKPDTVKVFNLLKAIDQLTGAQAAKEPYLISIGDKAEQIAQAFEERQQTTQATLDELRRLIEEVRQARSERDATQLSPESFAVYWLLKRDGVPKASEVAKATSEAFDQYPHWQTSSHQEQEVRKSFYKALIDAGVDGVVEIAQNILKMLRRAAK